MKRVEFIKLASLGGLALLAAPSCTDLSLDTSENKPTSPDLIKGNESNGLNVGDFSKTVGSPVPTKAARSWTGKFLKENNLENHFQIRKEDLEEILKSDDTNGVLFQLASNDKNKIELVLTNVSSSGVARQAEPFSIQGVRNENLF